MELRGQDQDMGIPIGYSTTTTTAVTGRRRNDHHQSTVLNPTQKTLDHHLHLHQQLNLHQQTHVVGRDPNPDPDPDPDPDPTPSPSPSPTIARASNSKTPPPPQPPPPSLEANSGSSASFRYRECLKNHAANMGCHVVDGCGEFMPSGEEGTPEELKCAACDCHRNFHRKEIEGESQQPGTNSYYPYNPNRNTTHRTTTTTHLPPPLPPPPPHHHHHHHRYAPPTGPIQPVMMAFGGGVAAESSSEGLNNMVFHCNDGTQPPMGIVQQPFTGSKKRFRTKFSQEQKDRMQEFAERLEWKIQKQDEEQVQQFCGEVGVKRQVFKVWMHNNKQAMKKKQL